MIMSNLNNKDYRISSHYSANICIQPNDNLDYAFYKILSFYKEVAEPYYKVFGNLNIIDEILNNKPNIISFHKQEQYFRYSIGLIIAKLNNRKNYKELEQQYDILVKEMSEMYIERYNQVKEYLKTV